MLMKSSEIRHTPLWESGNDPLATVVKSAPYLAVVLKQGMDFSAETSCTELAETHFSFKTGPKHNQLGKETF